MSRISPSLRSFGLLAGAVSLAAPLCLAQGTDSGRSPNEMADPGSEQALIERARRIHERVLTLDTHKDINATLALKPTTTDPDQLEAALLRDDPTVRGSNQVDFPKMREGFYDCGFYIVYVGQGQNDPAGFRRAYQQANLKFDAIERMCERFPQHIGFARTPADARRLHREGRLIAAIGIENGYPMGNDLGRVEEFQRRGARYMSIAHNRHSQLGDSHTPAEPLHEGLSPLGRDAVLEMNRVGIMVDVSHASKQTMMQVVEMSNAPVIASHSGCRAVCDNTRNLDDEQLLAMKRNRGVVQLVALDAYVRDQTDRRTALAKLREEIGLPRRGRRLADGTEIDAETFTERLAEYEKRLPEIDATYPRANVKDFIDHVDHAVKVMGIDHVGISSDFDGGGGIDGWNGAHETFNLTLEMVRRGYTEKQIAKIWSGNTLRVWAECQAIARLGGYRD